jgi:hypothetical protein
MRWAACWLVVRDPLFGSSGEPGIACSSILSGNYTACTNYMVGQVSGDTNYYISVTSIDPNQHVGVCCLNQFHSFSDSYNFSLACRREAWGANENAVAVFWPCPINFRSCMWLFFQSMRFQEEAMPLTIVGWILYGSSDEDQAKGESSGTRGTIS